MKKDKVSLKSQRAVVVLLLVGAEQSMAIAIL